jgi:hypothetical protein
MHVKMRGSICTLISLGRKSETESRERYATNQFFLTARSGGGWSEEEGLVGRRKNAVCHRLISTSSPFLSAADLHLELMACFACRAITLLLVNGAHM